MPNFLVNTLFMMDYKHILPDTLNIDKVIAVGHDWGGLVSWYMALYQPHRVLAEASSCTPYWNTLPENSKLESFVKIYPILACQLYLVQDQAAQVFDANIEKIFRLVYSFKCIKSPPMTQGMEELIPNLKRCHIEEASHYLLWESPDKANSVLKQWFLQITS
ncbi:hypothetical protein THRCLA_20566 [Thraustotheca clavata]|uniref:AB hydrolase-1 domain-containing protein n=1 Tax=Thraustotheca clavata TaxID=74557 RepID=A0A1W0A5Q6_9STRA|nr:hypothetical protein THRCLA_20566 [Thraustotheca clavata]